MDIQKALEKAIEFELYSRKFDSVEFAIGDSDFFKYVVSVFRTLATLEANTKSIDYEHLFRLADYWNTSDDPNISKMKREGKNLLDFIQFMITWSNVNISYEGAIGNV